MGCQFLSFTYFKIIYFLSPHCRHLPSTTAAPSQMIKLTFAMVCDLAHSNQIFILSAPPKLHIVLL